MIAAAEPIQDLSTVLDGKCPDCCEERFLRGPSGGLSTNIKCAGCGAKFNIVPRCVVMPRGFVERIGTPGPNAQAFEGLRVFNVLLPHRGGDDHR